jgi:hypothetical protein
MPPPKKTMFTHYPCCICPQMDRLRAAIEQKNSQVGAGQHWP